MRHGRPLPATPVGVRGACLWVPFLTPKRTLIGKSEHGIRSVVEMQHETCTRQSVSHTQSSEHWSRSAHSRSLGITENNCTRCSVAAVALPEFAYRPSTRLDFQQPFGNGRAFWLRLIKFDPHMQPGDWVDTDHTSFWRGRVHTNSTRRPGSVTSLTSSSSSKHRPSHSL